MLVRGPNGPNSVHVVWLITLLRMLAVRWPNPSQRVLPACDGTGTFLLRLEFFRRWPSSRSLLLGLLLLELGKAWKPVRSDLSHGLAELWPTGEYTKGDLGNSGRRVGE